MLWEVEIEARQHDPEKARVAAEFDLLTHGRDGTQLLARTARGYLLQGDLDRDTAQRLVDELLLDPVVEAAEVRQLAATDQSRERQRAVATQPLADARGSDQYLTVLLKPGVMDPVTQSIQDAARDLGVPLQAVRTFRRYYPAGDLPASVRPVLQKVLANDAIEQLVEGPLTLD